MQSVHPPLLLLSQPPAMKPERYSRAAEAEAHASRSRVSGGAGALLASVGVNQDQFRRSQHRRFCTKKRKCSRGPCVLIDGWRTLSQAKEAWMPRRRTPSGHLARVGTLQRGRSGGHGSAAPGLLWSWALGIQCASGGGLNQPGTAIDMKLAAV